MPYLEYPKALYLDGDTSKACKVVQNAQEEADEAKNGYQALPANPPPEPMEPGGPEHLPYPKMLYIGGEIGGATKVVQNAEEEAAEAANGFFALGSAAPAAGDENDEPKRAGRKKK